MSHNALPVGTTLGDGLEVRCVLGEGGFGITYLVHDHDLSKDFVVKEFFPASWVRRHGTEVRPLELEDAQRDFAHFLMRFQGEAQVAAKVDHPNLVKVHRFFRANGTGYFAMDWHDGETLDGVLKRRGLVAPAEAIALVDELLDGLTVLHAAGLIHRDIKPGNIYVRSNGKPLLLDFGSARAPAGSSASRQLTAVLSPGYAPFEQYTVDGIQGPHTDIYAVGAVLYRMLTGQEPLDAMTRRDEANTTRRHVPCASAAPVSVPRALCAIVDHAMAMDVAQRIPDAPTLRRALQATLATQAPGKPAPGARTAEDVPPRTRLNVQSDPPPPPWPHRHLGALLGVTAAAAIGVAASAFWWPGWARDPDPALTAAVTAATAVDTTADPQPTGVTSPPDPPVIEAVEPPPPGGQEVLQQVRASLPTGDLAVSVMLDPPSPQFVRGDYVSIGFSTKEDAYAAVFVYAQDGSVTMLYPNDYAKGQQVKANMVNWVGGDDQKFRIKVVPPFGTDLIHVVAFRNLDDLKLLLDALKLEKSARDLFLVDRQSLVQSAATIRTRGLTVVPVTGATTGAAVMRGWGDGVAQMVTQEQ